MSNTEPCKDCIRDGVAEPKTAERYQWGKPQCRRHHEQTRRRLFPEVCAAEGCSTHLKINTRNSRSCHCRAHEHLCLASKREGTVASALARVAENIHPDPETTCWIWAGKMTKGTNVGTTYGIIGVGSKTKACGGTGSKDFWYAHRFMRVWAYGGHPAKRQLDHLCGNSLCVNPAHLAALTPTEHKKMTQRRKKDPGEPWQRHANLNPLTMKYLSYAFQHGLPLRPGDRDWNSGLL